MNPSDSKCQLSDRSLFLFRSLVEYYIHDGCPVSSRALARGGGFSLSAATIRNTMADLEDLGLLQAPHTSAGRVPTVKGYRLFVDSLLQVYAPTSSDIQRVSKEIAGESNPQLLIKRTSELLSRITHLAGVVMLPKATDLTVRSIEFVPLSENRLLVVLVMSNNEIQNRIIDSPRRFSPSSLQQASNYLNELLRTRDLAATREQILEEMKRTRNDLNRLMQQAIEFAEQAFSDASKGKDDYIMAGETNLMGVAEFCDVEKLKRLFETFNQKQEILHLFDQAIQAQGVQIFIGEESGHKVLDDCSVVTATYEVEGQVVGVLGVIGPMRMPYDQVIPIVDVTARMLSTSLNLYN